jgi:hypothetical protein
MSSAAVPLKDGSRRASGVVWAASPSRSTPTQEALAEALVSAAGAALVAVVASGVVSEAVAASAAASTALLVEASVAAWVRLLSRRSGSLLLCH